MDATQRNKTIARRFYEILNTGDLDRYSEILPTDFIDHNPVPGQAAGLNGVKKALAGFRSSFPDIRFDIEDMIASQDKVVVRLTGRGTHLGDFMGVRPTGRHVEFAAIDIHRIDGNFIVESWHIEDIFGLMAQIGKLP